MTTGRINQVDIVPPSEGQRRSIALTSQGGLTNSPATECRRPPLDMTPKESSHMNSRLHFRARRRQAQQSQPESNTACRCVTRTQDITVYQITSTHDRSAKGTLCQICRVAPVSTTSTEIAQARSPNSSRRYEVTKTTSDYP